ncbi:unnamed protein product, partial [marine sediment metagenome]
GLGELLADLAGAIMFGPCLRFALYQIATTPDLEETPSEKNDYYPPWGYRLQKIEKLHETSVVSLAQVLEQSGFDHAVEHVNHFLEEISNFTAINIQDLLESWPASVRYPYEVIEGELGKLESWVRTKIGELQYSADPQRLADFCRDLDAGLPPVLEECLEQKPADFRDILNAGWLYLITRLKETAACLENGVSEYRTGRRKLDLLILKAIESSYLLEQHIPKR